MKSFDKLNFLIVLLRVSTLTPGDLIDHWVAWNVGQGQWVTHIENSLCTHYDVGGELGSFARVRKKLQPLCLQKQNRLLLSHWDFDHYSNIKNLARIAPSLCWLSQPKEQSEKKTALDIQQLALRSCLDQDLFTQQKKFWRPENFKNSNDSSGVYWQNGVLLPGDSPQPAEKKWLPSLQKPAEVRVLILGHHGSHTSTSELLLNRLPGLKMAIASARYQKYHHPSHLTLKRLQKHRIPVLRTEDFGDIHFN